MAARRKRWLVALTLLAAASTGPPSSVASPGGTPGRILVATPGAFRMTDGTPAIVGATMDISEADGGRFTIRIDWTEPDAGDPAREISLTGLSYRRAPGEPWRPLCKPDHEGRSVAFPIVASGQPGFSIACTSDARGKCTRFGYKPWKSADDGAPLLPLYQACLRMVRADYCGSGDSHTRAGVFIRMWDNAGIRPRPADARAEASWTPSGAACVRRARAESVSTLGKIVAACPSMAGKLAATCDAAATPDTLLWSEAAD